MDINAIIVATVVVAAVGLFIGIFLGVAGKKFAVEVDEKKLLSVKHFRETTVVDVDIRAVMVWQQRSPKEKHRSMHVR